MKSLSINGVLGMRRREAGEESDETGLAATKTFDLPAPLKSKKD
jgi:hypothetical protein